MRVPLAVLVVDSARECVATELKVGNRANMSGITGIDHAALFQAAAQNADYETANGGSGDPAKALAFIGVVNQLLIVVPMQQKEGGVNRVNEIAFQPEVWERRLDAARRWYASHSATQNVANSSVRHLGIGSWR